MRALEKNIFLFKFSSDEVVEAIFKKGPWNIKKYRLNLKKYDPSISVPDQVFTHQEWNVQFKNILIEHHSAQVIDETLIELGPKIKITPDNCRPVAGSMITARVKIDLKKPIHIGGWWNTASSGVTWVRYHWERQPHLLCKKCFTIDHDDDECENTELDLKIRRYTNEEYVNYCHNLARAYRVEITEDLDLLLQRVCEVSQGKLEEKEMAEKQEEERRTKRERSEYTEETSRTNATLSPVLQSHAIHKNIAGLNTGSTDRLEHFDGMEHNLTEEGELPTREYSHERNEATVILVLAWNVQGLAKRFTKDQVFVLVKKHSPDFLFLSETKIDSDKMISLSIYLSYYNYVHIDRVELDGGLILMWMDGIHCEVQDVSKNIMHVITKIDPSKPYVLITFMYGSTYFDKKKEQWEFLLRISENIRQPWTILGDLNFHMHNISEAVNHTIEDRYVKDKVDICGLMNIGYSGKHYTWTSNSFGTGSRKSRIDMALGNNYWCNFFPHAKLMHLVQAGSDHCFQLIAKQHNTRKRLSQWNKIEFGDIDGNINLLQAQLETAQNNLLPDTQHENIVILTKKLDECDDIANLFVSHFEKVSKTSKPSFSDTTIDIIPTVITANDNSQLNRIPSSDEIFETIKHMNDWGSPGPDGFQSGFYKYNWDIVGKDVTNAIQNFFETGFMPTEFNKTYLSLIPKTDNATKPMDFGPIGLRNTIYKVISKIMADRVKPHLNILISPYQAAFVPGRDIHDNIIIAHEMIHSMKLKEGHSGTMALKLDLSKVFDRIEWPFLLGVLKSFGFDEKFCGYVNQCISTTHIYVLLNESPTHGFNPSRGLRQGDPLSPYLFILCVELLSRLFLNAETNHQISGVKAARNAPGITHLMFADDILIFAQADLHNITSILNTLDYFGSVSGQMLNISKSSVYFSHNRSPNTKQILAEELNMTEMKLT
ncbi:uncharacterized protein LOC113352390 [Papaver somniferum]|uniref:uncharacterized protein LOC113352390 n=1 Tax=Papaver somniferum TaxID=3469 RepID=UPI000E6FC95E|nr:uncharacterized protein LOC113352390 [Papaver somniferum]